MVEQGCKHGFLILILGKEQNRRVRGYEHIQWRNPEDLGGYNDTIQAKDMVFDQSKSEKKHARRLLEYEKILGVEESRQILILQAVEVLKEEYRRYGG